MIKSVVTAFDIKYAHDVIFKLDVEENLMLTTDRMHLSNIISNLIDNAIKYSYQESGSVILKRGETTKIKL